MAVVEELNGLYEMAVVFVDVVVEIVVVIWVVL